MLSNRPVLSHIYNIFRAFQSFFESRKEQIKDCFRNYLHERYRRTLRRRVVAPERPMPEFRIKRRKELRLRGLHLQVYDDDEKPRTYVLELEEWDILNISGVLKLLSKKPWWNKLPTYKRKLHEVYSKPPYHAVCVVELPRPRISDFTVLTNEPDKFDD